MANADDILNETEKPVLEYQAPSTQSSGQGSMKKAAMSGALWTFGGFGAIQVARFAANLIMARVLLPDVFGLIGLVYSIITGLLMFSDVGLGQAIIQAKRGEDRNYINTAWTMQAVRGAIILGVVTLLSPLLAKIYSEPKLYWVAPIAASTALIDGFASMSLFLFPKRMRLKEVTIVETVSQFLGIVAMVVAAFITRNVFSQLIGAIVGSTARTLGSHWINRQSPDRFSFDKSAMQEQLAFGRWIFLSSVLTFLAMQSDRLLLPTKVSSAVFGVYYIAVMIVMVPSQVLSRIASRVIFPAFSQTINAGRALTPVFSRSRLVVMIGAGASMVMLVAAGHPIIKFLYPKTYDDAGKYVTLLAIAIWFQVLDSTNQAALLAEARGHWTAIIHAVKLVFAATFLYVGLHYWGVPGAVLSVVASDFIKYLTSSFACVRAKLPLMKVDFFSSLWFGIIAFGGWLLIGKIEMHSRPQWALGSAIGALLGAVAAGVFYLIAIKRRKVPATA